MPRRACPEIVHRNAKRPFFGKATVSVCVCPGRRTRVLFFFTMKSCGCAPRFRTTNRTVEPAGTDFRDRAKEKSRASTRIVNVRVGAGSAAAASESTAVAAAARSAMSRAARATPAGYSPPAAGRWSLTDSLGQEAAGHRRLGAGLDAVALRLGLRGDDLPQLRPLEGERRRVVGGVAGREAPVHELAVDGAAQRLAVVVRAEASGEDRESVVQRVERRSERVRDARLEPAVRAGTPAAEHRASPPGGSELVVDAVDAPDGQHVRGVAAGNED